MLPAQRLLAGNSFIVKCESKSCKEKSCFKINLHIFFMTPDTALKIFIMFRERFRVKKLFGGSIITGLGFNVRQLS